MNTLPNLSKINTYKIEPAQVTLQRSKLQLIEPLTLVFFGMVLTPLELNKQQTWSVTESIQDYSLEQVFKTGGEISHNHRRMQRKQAIGKHN